MGVVMRETHPVFARAAGHSLFAIRRLSLAEKGLRTVAMLCSQALISTDARDKYFIVHAAEHMPVDIATSRAVKEDVAIAAKSLAAAVSSLHDAQHDLPSCVGSPSAMHTTSPAGIGISAASAASPQFDAAEALEVLKVARAVVIHMRSMLL